MDNNTDRTTHDVEEDGFLPSPQPHYDEVTNNVFLQPGGRFINVIGEEHPVYVTRSGPAYEPIDETPDNECARVPRYSRSITMQHYNIEKNRFESFRNNWSPTLPVSPDDLARAGFRYLGPPDRVKCVFCNGVLSGWEEGDNPYTEHKKHFPNCLFMLGHNVNNVPYKRHISTIERTIPAQIETTLVQYNPPSLQKPKHPLYRIKSDRLVTFNDWPTQMKQKPEDLAEAGLFYLGHGDKVKCFICDGMLHSWEPNDEPWIEHAKWFPDCAYVQLIKGDEFIKDVQTGKITTLYQQQEVEMVDTERPSEFRSENLSIPRLESCGMETSNTALARSGSSSIARRESCAMETTNTALESLDINSKDEYHSLVEENQILKDQRLCKICLENEISIVFLPCGHVCCCGECSMSVQSCPFCRKDIDRRVKAYLS